MNITLRERNRDICRTEFPVNGDIQVMGNINDPVNLAYETTQFKFERTVAKPPEQCLGWRYPGLVLELSLIHISEPTRLQ